MTAIFPASTTGGGQCVAMAPDTCITPQPPPVGSAPIPYPNTSMVNQANNASTKVQFVSKEAVTLKSKMSQSMGDEAGTNKGVMSGMNMGEVAFKKGSSKVKIEGQPAIHLTSPTGHNGSNANAPAGMQAAPSQVKVLIS